MEASNILKMLISLCFVAEISGKQVIATVDSQTLFLYFGIST